MYSVSANTADKRLDRAVIECRELEFASVRKSPMCLNCPKARQWGCRHVRAFIEATSPDDDNACFLADSLDDICLNSDDEDGMDGDEANDLSTDVSRLFFRIRVMMLTGINIIVPRWSLSSKYEVERCLLERTCGIRSRIRHSQKL